MLFKLLANTADELFIRKIEYRVNEHNDALMKLYCVVKKKWDKHFITDFEFYKEIRTLTKLIWDY